MEDIPTIGAAMPPCASGGAAVLPRQRQEQMLVRLNEVYANGMQPAEKRLLRGIKAKVRPTVKERW
jgi:hypothetical protein